MELLPIRLEQEIIRRYRKGCDMKVLVRYLQKETGMKARQARHQVYAVIYRDHMLRKNREEL